MSTHILAVQYLNKTNSIEYDQNGMIRLKIWSLIPNQDQAILEQFDKQGKKRKEIWNRKTDQPSIVGYYPSGQIYSQIWIKNHEIDRNEKDPFFSLFFMKMAAI